MQVYSLTFQQRRERLADDVPEHDFQVFHCSLEAGISGMPPAGFHLQVKVKKKRIQAQKFMAIVYT